MHLTLICFPPRSSLDWNVVPVVFWKWKARCIVHLSPVREEKKHLSSTSALGFTFSFQVNGLEICQKICDNLRFFSFIISPKHFLKPFFFFSPVDFYDSSAQQYGNKETHLTTLFFPPLCLNIHTCPPHIAFLKLIKCNATFQPRKQWTWCCNNVWGDCVKFLVLSR